MITAVDPLNKIILPQIKFRVAERRGPGGLPLENLISIYILIKLYIIRL